MAQQPQARLSQQMKEDMRNQVDTVGNGASQLVEHAAKRLQDISLESYRYIQGAAEMNADVMTRLIGCRTIGEMADVQRDYLKGAIDHAFAASRRMYGMGAEMADEIGSSVNATLHTVAEEAGRQREDAAKRS